jgi:hypothetical protein
MGKLNGSVGNGPAPTVVAAIEECARGLGVPQQGEAQLELRFECGADGRPRLVDYKILAELMRLPRGYQKRLQRLVEAADLLAALAEETGADLTPFVEPEPAARRPGRPDKAVTSDQRRQILWLSRTNGRLGTRAIGRRVKPPLGWRAVQRVLDEYSPSAG